MLLTFAYFVPNGFKSFKSSKWARNVPMATKAPIATKVPMATKRSLAVLASYEIWARLKINEICSLIIHLV